MKSPTIVNTGDAVLVDRGFGGVSSAVVERVTDQRVKCRRDIYGATETAWFSRKNVKPSANPFSIGRGFPVLAAVYDELSYGKADCRKYKRGTCMAYSQDGITIEFTATTGKRIRQDVPWIYVATARA